MCAEERMGLRLLCQPLVKKCAGYMQLARIPQRPEKHRASAAGTETAAGFGQAIPAQQLLWVRHLDIALGEAHPRDKRGAVRALATAAMAVRHPLWRKISSKQNRAA